MESNKKMLGKVNQLPSKIDRKDVMVTISIRMEGDLLDAIRARSEGTGIPYQTLMKRIIREHLQEPGSHPEVSAHNITELSQRLDRVVMEVVHLKRALAAKGTRPTKRGDGRKRA